LNKERVKEYGNLKNVPIYLQTVYFDWYVISHTADCKQSPRCYKIAYIPPNGGSNCGRQNEVTVTRCIGRLDLSD